MENWKNLNYFNGNDLMLRCLLARKQGQNLFGIKFSHFDQLGAFFVLDQSVAKKNSWRPRFFNSILKIETLLLVFQTLFEQLSMFPVNYHKINEI